MGGGFHVSLIEVGEMSLSSVVMFTTPLEGAMCVNSQIKKKQKTVSTCIMEIVQTIRGS